MKKAFFITLVALCALGCPKGPETTVDTPVSDTLVVDSIAVDSVK